MPLRAGPGIFISADHSGPLSATSRIKPTSCSSLTVSAAARTYLLSVLPNLQLKERLAPSPTGTFLSEGTRAAYSRTTASSFVLTFLALHPNGNGGVGGVKHTMSQRLAMTVNGRQGG